MLSDDTADVEHALVIWGHEVWHMMEGHCAAHTPVGSAAARSRSARGAAVEQVVGALLAVPDARLGGVPGGDLKYATRTDFHAAQEAEAERFRAGVRHRDARLSAAPGPPPGHRAHREVARPGPVGLT